MGDIADHLLENWYEDGEEYDNWRLDVMQASGIIGFVKDRKTAKGLTTYSFTFDDREDERWFGTYDQKPPSAGVFVTFEYVTNKAGFNNVDEGTLVVTEQEEAAAPTKVSTTATKAKAAYLGGGNKDANIQWQSARNAAINFLTAGIAAGAVDLGTGKKEVKLDVLLLAMNRLTVDLFTQSMEVGRTGDTPEELQG